MGYIGGWYFGEHVFPQLRPHRIARACPMLSRGEFAALRASIKERGLDYPITRLPGDWLEGHGPSLDGWHRYLACLMEGVPPRFEWYKGPTDDAALIGFVRSRNINRRHLDESQRAMVAARHADWKLGTNQHTPGSANLQTQAELAVRYNVSKRLIADAVKVLNDGVPGLIRAV